MTGGQRAAEKKAELRAQAAAVGALPPPPAAPAAAAPAAAVSSTAPAPLVPAKRKSEDLEPSSRRHRATAATLAPPPARPVPEDDDTPKDQERAQAEALAFLDSLPPPPPPPAPPPPKPRDVSHELDEEQHLIIQQWLKAKRARNLAKELPASGASRARNFAKLREELRDLGIDPDGYRANIDPYNRAGGYAHSPQVLMIQEWIEAKRLRNFAKADQVRQQLRDLGIEPDGYGANIDTYNLAGGYAQSPPVWPHPAAADSGGSPNMRWSSSPTPLAPSTVASKRQRDEPEPVAAPKQPKLAASGATAGRLQQLLEEKEALLEKIRQREKMQAGVGKPKRFRPRGSNGGGAKRSGAEQRAAKRGSGRGGAD